MRALIVALLLLGLVTAAISACAERRVAFVMGNGAYKHLPSLPNPATDAEAMKKLLKSAGFEVVEAIDVTRDQLTNRLLKFGKKAKGADIALFYYTGQGIAVGGSNYLIPVDADIKSEMDVKLGNAVELETAIEQTMRGAAVRLVFFDASRNDPFPESGLLTKPVSAGQPPKAGASTGSRAPTKVPGGTLIEYATGPGETASDGNKGDHSPFTRALLANIAAPGIEIQQAMTMVRAEVSEATNKDQMPWGHTELVGSVYLKPVKGSPGASSK